MLYLDIFSGISGDMFIGALLDLGLPLNHLQAELARLQLSGYHLHARRGRKAGIEGVKFDVHLEDHDHSHDHGPEHGHDHPHADGPAPAHGHDHDHGHHHHDHDHDHGHAPEPGHDHDQDESHDHPHDHGRTHAEIRDLIQRSDLNAWIKARALSVFHRLAVAEGKIHGLPPESVQFHEVGALDSIVDVVGVCVGLDWLGRPPVLAGPVIEGTGFVRCAHGRMPLPAPATLEIFATRGVGITQCDEPGELVTPTGAALLAEFAVSFGRLTGFHPERVGYGLGTRDNRTRPNVLRAVLGQATTEVAAAGRDWETDIVTVLESNLDDISPEMLGHFVERALGAGALDVFHTSVQMKKNRPGTLLTVLCAAEASEMFAELILRETSAFGVRETLASRRKLRREFIKVSTPHGEITIKIGRLNDEVVQLAPEFESCRQAAARTGVPIKTVYETALTRATTQMGRTPATGT